MIKTYMCEEFCNIIVEGSQFISVTKLNKLVLNFWKCKWRVAENLMLKYTGAVHIIRISSKS